MSIVSRCFSSKDSLLISLVQGTVFVTHCIIARSRWKRSKVFILFSGANGSMVSRSISSCPILTQVNRLNSIAALRLYPINIMEICSIIIRNALRRWAVLLAPINWRKSLPVDLRLLSEREKWRNSSSLSMDQERNIVNRWDFHLLSTNLQEIRRLTSSTSIVSLFNFDSSGWMIAIIRRDLCSTCIILATVLLVRRLIGPSISPSISSSLFFVILSIDASGPVRSPSSSVLGSLVVKSEDDRRSSTSRSPMSLSRVRRFYWESDSVFIAINDWNYDRSS